MVKIKTKDAFVTSLISAVVIGLLYWVLKALLSGIEAWMVGVVVFLVAFIGMKWKDWVK